MVYVEANNEAIHTLHVTLYANVGIVSKSKSIKWCAYIIYY